MHGVCWVSGGLWCWPALVGSDWSRGAGCGKCVMSDELVGQVSEEWENNLHSLW